MFAHIFWTLGSWLVMIGNIKKFFFPIKPTQCVKVMLCNVVDVGNLCFYNLVKKCGTYLFFCLRCCAVYGFPERQCSYICRSTLAFVTIPTTNTIIAILSPPTWYDNHHCNYFNYLFDMSTVKAKARCPSFFIRSTVSLFPALWGWFWLLWSRRCSWWWRLWRWWWWWWNTDMVHSQCWCPMSQQ